MTQPTLSVKDAAGSTQTVNTINPNGAAAAAASQPVALATDQDWATKTEQQSGNGKLSIIATNVPPQGPAAKAASMPVTMATDQPAISVNTVLKKVSLTFTRPTNTTPLLANYVVGQASAAALAFAAIFSANGASGYIVKAKIATDQNACVAAFRLWLYNVTPTSSTTDGTAAAPAYADIPGLIGFIDFPALQAENSGSVAALAQWTGQLAALAAVADTAIYGILETKTAFTPASGQSFTIDLTMDRN